MIQVVKGYKHNAGDGFDRTRIRALVRVGHRVVDRLMSRADLEKFTEITVGWHTFLSWTIFTVKDIAAAKAQGIIAIAMETWDVDGERDEVAEHWFETRPNNTDPEDYEGAIVHINNLSRFGQVVVTAHGYVVDQRDITYPFSWSWYRMLYGDDIYQCSPQTAALSFLMAHKAVSSGLATH